MDTFIKNYWSLYMDFLEDFEEIEYKGISLPYLCHLPSLILKDDQLLNELKSDDFSKNLKHQISNQKEFQEVFNHFIKLHENPLQTNKDGKVVIHSDKLLRIPYNSIMEYFNPSKTIILGTKLGKVKQTPYYYKNKDKIDKYTRNNFRMRTDEKKYQKYRAKSLKENISQPKKLRAKSLLDVVNWNMNWENLRKKRTENNINTQYIKRKMSNYYLSNYEVNVKESINQVQKKAIDLFDSYKGHFFYDKNEFQKWFLNMIATVINYVEMSERFLEKVSVSCIIVSTTHSYINRILAIAAAKRGIPTICMQHGIISSELGYLPKIATIDAVYGNFERDWYKKMGAPRNGIEIIGHPRFDQVFKPSRKSRAKFLKKLGVNPRRKAILIAVRGDADNNSWRQLIRTISNNLNVNFLIKNYPSKQPHRLTKEFSNVYSTERMDIYDIFPHVDLVVAYSSTVGLEAMLANKEVFILNKGVIGDTDYYQRLGSLLQKEPRILGRYIVEYFTNSKFKKHSKKNRKIFLQYAYPDTDKSGDRLQKLIQKLTS
ncbi:hypothetical protein NC661_13335 [Aquibacillus koreensis]|uniref:Spore coat protein n=1 Tax=Aquibacillus koreensis TaxID=279446 RepID=A0A9X3WMI5_9BACI|nr:hypothetical protein [Aquibacillus koreensis]MCT2536296.1 hypothetical protein [Aquibacillus koreensis]MDC3421353.1 hypothetical protein [Aquibacillus koreensis]